MRAFSNLCFLFVSLNLDFCYPNVEFSGSAYINARFILYEQFINKTLVAMPLACVVSRSSRLGPRLIVAVQAQRPRQKAINSPTALCKSLHGAVLKGIQVCLILQNLYPHTLQECIIRALIRPLFNILLHVLYKNPQSS